MEKALVDLPLLNEVLRSTDEETYDKTATTLMSRLSKLSIQELAQKDILDNLSPSALTIPYLVAVCAAIDQVSATGKAAARQLPNAVLPEGSIWPYITQILLNFDPIQVRYAGIYLTRLVSLVAQGAEQTGNIIPAVQLLHNVILRLDPTSSTFTSTHHSYLRLCLLAQAYSEALDILDRPIYHIPAAVDKQTAARSYEYLCSDHDSSATYLTTNTGLTQKTTSRGYLEYYLMGAMCYMGTSQYKKAITFLEIVTLSPAQPNFASLIMVDAYKRWVLLNLLVYGNVRPIQGAQPTTIRNIKAISKVYDCIAEAFMMHDAQRLRAEIHEAGDIWEKDSNLGLITEVFHAHRKFAVKKLGETYAAISVKDVAKLTPNNDVDETLSYLQDLIARGNLNATIVLSRDGNDQILRFLPAKQQPEVQVEQELATKTQQLQFLLKHINAVDHRMELSKEYLDYLRKLRKTRDEDHKKDGGGEDVKKGVTVDEFDEDVMDEF